MTTMKAQGVLLTADADTRVLRYRLLPYSEPGRTSLGTITASAGSLTLPELASALVLNLEHQPTSPLGRGVSLTEEDTGLTATFRIARTRAGDDLLAENAEDPPLRPGISVEIEDPVIRGGKLLSGRLTGAGAVVAPAFPSALLVASDIGEPPAETEPEPEDDEDETEQDPEHQENEETQMTTTAAAPAGLAATRAAGPEVKTARDFARLQANAHATRDPKLMAALADITYSDLDGDIHQHQWLDELWSGRSFQRQVVPLLGHGDLTAMTVDGWAWKTKPEVDDYTGDKADVPSNTVETEPQSVPASRLAGAHDIDRAFRDFPNEGYWAGYNQAMVESYARKSDAKVTASLIAAAPATAGGTVPAGVSKAMAFIVDGSIKVLPTAVPTFAIVGLNLYRDLLLTRSDDALTFLNASLGLEGGSAVSSFKIVPSAASALASKVLVGTSSAATVHEVPGSPIRVEAMNIGQGGIDVGFFGYIAFVLHDKDGLALVA